MRKYLNIFLWIAFFSLMAPSGMVLASWDAVPGDSTYTWKIALENGLLAVLPSNKLKSTTHSKLTERRLGEVSKVLSGVHAREGLDNLSAQIINTKESLNKIDNTVDKQAAVTLYIQTLNQVSTQLEKESRALTSLPAQNNTDNNYNINQLKKTDRYIAPTTNINKKALTKPTTQQPSIKKPTQVQPEIIKPATPPTIPAPITPKTENIIKKEIVEEIDETQEEIESIIEELENIIEEAEEQDQQDSLPQNEQNQKRDDNKGRNDDRNRNNNKDKENGRDEDEVTIELKP